MQKLILYIPGDKYLCNMNLLLVSKEFSTMVEMMILLLGTTFSNLVSLWIWTNQYFNPEYVKSLMMKLLKSQLRNEECKPQKLYLNPSLFSSRSTTWSSGNLKSYWKTIWQCKESKLFLNKHVSGSIFCWRFESFSSRKTFHVKIRQSKYSFNNMPFQIKSWNEW